MTATTPKLINLFDYEDAASRALDANTYGYYVGGACDEVTLRENRTAFDQMKLLPKMLVDVSQRDTSTKLFDGEISFPLVIAPMALMQLAHPEGELAVARAAGRLDVPMALSTLSTYSIEAVGEAASAPLWFQLYVYRDRAITEQLVARAEQAGCTALVLTVDVAVPGHRERDVRNSFKLPPGVKVANMTDMALADMQDQPDDSAIARYAVSQLDPSLTWDDVKWLVSLTDLPVIIKGILRADDAKRAMDVGAAGVVVSNHGGRQLDTAPAAIDVLPGIVDAVGFEGAVLMDGGVRRGTDIFKALALGAQAVMLGRPALWGLAVDGQQGVEHTLDILKREFDTTMALCGCTTVNEIKPDFVMHP
jgi:4-hydroxymandelate oxidase